MIKLANVSKYYSSNNVIALGLRKVNLELHRNEFVAIVGESGSGKTTLLNVISGIDSYEDGEMYVNGKETSYYSVSDMENYRKDYVAFVFQNYNLIDSYTVLQNVEAPLILSGFPKDKIRARAKEIIKRVGLDKHMNHKATRLSGGQKQRVVIARALAKDCPIIAADEPTGNLDSKSAKQVIELLHEIAKEKLVIIVTHDFSQVEDYATRKIRVFDGEIVEDLKLKKVDKLDLPTIDHKENQIKFKDYLTISLRNLLAVPKKTLLMLVIFTFFSFFVALTYGAYQLVMTESSIAINQEFINSNPNRIVVRKSDGSEFTADDITDLEDYNNNIVEVVTRDYVLDHTLYLENNIAGSYGWLDGVFMPDSFLDEDDLEYGRMPTSDNEIVIAGDSGYLRDYEEFLNYTFSTSEWSSQPDLSYKIVGMVDISNYSMATYQSYDCFFFGTDDNFEYLQEIFYLYYINSASFTADNPADQISFYIGNSEMVVLDSLEANEITVSGNKAYTDCSDSTTCTYTGDLVIDDYYKTIELDDIDVIVDKTITDYNSVFVSQEIYDQIIYDDIYQATILTRSEIGVTSIINDLQRESDGILDYTYHVSYPFDTVETSDFEALIMLISSIGLIMLNVIVLLGSTLITYVIFRAIINTKLPDYAIFRTIGANKEVIKRFIYFENFYIVIGAYLFFLVVSISLPFDLVQDTFFYPLKVFSFWNYIVYLGLLFIMAGIISRRYCNKIFSKTVQTTLKTDMG